VQFDGFGERGQGTSVGGFNPAPRCAHQKARPLFQFACSST
jgi:hypothetical protein